jgi:uncharacterized protein (TIGR00369 family)
MKKINPEYIERVNQITNESPYFSLLSMKICDAGIGYSILEIDLAEKHLQPYGTIHGGVFASLIDAATFWAVFYGVEEEDAGVTSVDLKLNYLNPVTSGRLMAKGRQIKLGKSLGYAEAEVRNGDNEIVAHGTSLLMVLSGKGLSKDLALPPKFIDWPISE